MSKTKFEHTSNSKCLEVYVDYCTGYFDPNSDDFKTAFKYGSEFGYEYGLNEERERAAKLLSALKEIENEAHKATSIPLATIAGMSCKAYEAIKNYEGDD